MAKVGLKETLQLLAAGYKKKDIEALAALDEETTETGTVGTSTQDQEQAPESPPVETATTDPEPEPDYKALYEEQLKKAKEAEEKLKKVQKDNINSNSAPDAAAAKEKQSEDLLKLVSSFM